MPRPHQPDEAVFRSVLPEAVEWRPFPAFPPSARLAILVGHPLEPGPYVIRVKVPSGVKLMPHRHPEDRVYTVMSGVFYIGLGDRFDGDKVAAYPPGSVIVLPGNTSHFHWAKSGEYVTQVSAIGPLGLEYLDPRDDPRAPGHLQQAPAEDRSGVERNYPPITRDYVRDVFRGLENGDGAAFFEHVAPDVDWTVMGTHPLAGHYRGKADFIAGTFARLGRVLPEGAELHLENLMVDGDEAAVELHSLATAKNGLRFDNRYCWIVRFDGDMIVRVRAYLDTALVAQLFKENPAA